MTQFKNLKDENAEKSALRAENASLRVALRQAQDFCVAKEKKSIEYIFHLGQYKSRLINRLEEWGSRFFSSSQDRGKTKGLSPVNQEALYAHWLEKFDCLDADDIKKISKHIELFFYAPRFTLILDCRDKVTGEIEQSLASITNQLYKNFDLLLCIDEEKLLELTQIQAQLSGSGVSNKIICLSPSSSARDLSNALAPEIVGELVAFLTAGDQLHATALYEFAAELDLYPETQALYADEDALTEAGQRVGPFFKPDWNRELFLGQNYVGAFCLMARERFFNFSKKENLHTLEAINFYALLDAPRETVRHIPAVLFHRRTADQGRGWTRRDKALTQDYLGACSVRGDAIPLTDFPHWIEIRREGFSPFPLVTIIIPTRNRPDLLSVSLHGVLTETAYKNIEVIIVDHENDHPGVLEIFKSLVDDVRVTILPYKGVFDHSDMNNRAAQIARGDILLFLNDDIEVIDPDWLMHLVAQFAHKDRGVVGARLLYPDRRIQHAGVILGFGGVAGHGFVGLGADEAGYFGRLRLASEVSALTGACMAMSRELFEEVGGFSAHHLQRTFNDVDLCLKVMAKGKVNIYTPLATLIHHESATDGGDVKLKHYKRLQGEVSYMLETWGLMRADPYYNVNLALEGTSFSLAFPPRRVPPWVAIGL